MEIFFTAKKNLKQVKNYTPGKPIEELEREYGVKKAVKMASNENAIGPSPKAVKAIRKALPNLHRYPDGGCFYLRQKLSKFLNVRPGSIVFGNGSDELLVFAVRAFVGRGDQVIIADPTFLIYEIAAQAENGSIVKVPIKNFSYDLRGMLAKITPRTKLIFIANPDNPVGTYISEEKLKSFLNRVPKHVVVVLDEAYYEFALSKKDYPNSLSLLKNRKNLVICRTFSKIYGLAGLRIGYAITDESIAAALNKVREPFNVNLLAQIGAGAALDDKAHLTKTLRIVDIGRRFLSRQLAGMGLRLIETATNFILVDLGVDARDVYEKLLKKGVIVRPMSAWGMPNFLRVTIGNELENKKFVEVLRKILR